MLSRARRVPSDTETSPFPWTSKEPARTERPARADAPVVDEAALSARAEAIERDAFAKGYAHGERAGQAAMAERADAVMAELARTVQAISAERASLLRRTERDVVRLALAMTARIVHREIGADPELLLAMARVAIDRLGEHVTASVHLHPDDHRGLTAALAARPSGDPPVFALVADPQVARGGCLVTSDYGVVDLAVDAQVAELSRALIGTPAGPQGPVDGVAGR